MISNFMGHSWTKPLLIRLWGLVIFILLLTGIVHAQEITGTVVSVLDGDTIEVLQEKTPYRIRLYGVDCPEKRQDFGTQAKKFTSDMVFGKTVRVDATATDKYGRTIGMVYAGEACLNEKLVKSGFAWVYRAYCKDGCCKKFIEYEIQARVGKLGLWSHGSPVPPWDFRRKGKVSKNQTPADPSGSYHGNIQSKVFHKRGCRYFDCKKCTNVLNNRDEAVQAGYKPCKICKP